MSSSGSFNCRQPRVLIVAEQRIRDEGDQLPGAAVRGQAYASFAGERTWHCRNNLATAMPSSGTRRRTVGKLAAPTRAWTRSIESDGCRPSSSGGSAPETSSAPAGVTAMKGITRRVFRLETRLTPQINQRSYRIACIPHERRRGRFEFAGLPFTEPPRSWTPAAAGSFQLARLSRGARSDGARHGAISPFRSRIS